MHTPFAIAKTYQMAPDCFLWSFMKLDVQHWVDSYIQNSRRKRAPQKHGYYLTTCQSVYPFWQGYLSVIGPACFLRGVSTLFESEISSIIGMGPCECQIKKRRQLRELLLNFGSISLGAVSTSTVIREQTKCQNSYDNSVSLMKLKRLQRRFSNVKESNDWKNKQNVGWKPP